jgi:hypothetical protein
MMKSRILLSSLALGILATGANAWQASALLREGDPLPGAPAGHVVTAISNTATNTVLGEYACTVNSFDGLTTLSHAWGNAGGLGSPTVLFSEGLYGTLDQTSWESFFGVDDVGNVAYSPLSNDTTSAVTGLDGCWWNGTVVANEDDPIPPLPGKVYRFNSRPNATGNGLVVWVAGIDDAGGAIEGNGLFTYDGVNVVNLLKTGDMLPLPGGGSVTLDASAADFDFRFSALGTHYALSTDTTLGTTVDGYVIYDGALYLDSTGAPIAEGTPIPAAQGGMVGENWDNFDLFGVNEAGDVMFTGDTDGATTTDEFIAKNGTILYREGDVVDGFTLTGSLEGAYMSESGDISYVWDVEDGGGGSLEALFVNDKFLLKEGDPVDWDGNGYVESANVVDNFTGISALTMSSHPVSGCVGHCMLFTADIDVGGVLLEGLFRVENRCLKADNHVVSVAAGGTMTMDLDAGLANAGNGYLVAGTTTGSSPGFLFQGLTVPLNPSPYLNTSIIFPNLDERVNTLGLLDAAGRAQAAIVVPSGANPGLVGLTVDYAYLAFSAPPIVGTLVGGSVSLTLEP